MKSQIINRLLTVTRLNTTVVPVYLLLSNDRQLPEHVVSHYKTNMLAMSFLVGFRSDVGPQLLILHIPSLLSIPNKEIWLADDSRETTLNTKRTYKLQLGIVSILMICWIIQTSINCSLNAANNSHSMNWMILGGFGLYTTILIIRPTRRFRHDPSQVVEEA